MSILARKLRRDLWRTRTQVLSIALVLSGGVMSVVALRGTSTALERARDAYYAESRFADVFASVTRAPNEVASRLAAIPGVATVATRVVKDVRLDVPGLPLPGVAHLVALPAHGRAADAPLNVVRVMSGREPAAGADDEILVSGRFGAANALRPGDSLTAVINERRVRFRVVGVGASPDYMFEEAGAGMFSDERSFGILWVPSDRVEAAAGLQGAFNDVALSLTQSASTSAVIAEVDSLLAPFGGRGAVSRDDQLSHRVVTDEMHQMAVMAMAFPLVFVGVAAFLVGSVLSRLVATEREQIAVLKAFGYRDRAIALHYLAYAASAVAVGAIIGVLVGVWIGGLYTQIYADVLRIPGLRYRADWGTIGGAVSVLAIAALSGALASVLGAARLTPAQALLPVTPARYRMLLMDRLGLGHFLSPTARMVLRSLERRPSRSMIGAAGVAGALAMMAGALSMYDASFRMIDVQFRIGHREALAVQLVSSSPRTVRAAFAALPGVSRVELTRAVPVRLRHAGQSQTVAVTGLEGGSLLHRLVDADGRVYHVPPDGLVISASLARTLAVERGDSVDVDLLERGVSRRAVVVAALDELMSPNAYADIATVDRLVGDGALATGAYLHLDGAPHDELFARVREIPRVASVTSRGAMLDRFDRMMAKGLRVTTSLVTIFASVIALGVVYNGARIALSERGRELASLRVLGFTTREVGAMLLGEQAILTVVSLPLGWAAGRLFAEYLSTAFQSERFRIPPVTRPSTYAFASVVVLAAASFAGALMYRRAARLDLVAVLKTRE